MVVTDWYLFMVLYKLLKLKNFSPTLSDSIFMASLFAQVNTDDDDANDDDDEEEWMQMQQSGPRILP